MNRYAFPAALILATLSGCAALAHEALWTRRLVDLLGASGESTSRVFGAFFLGLALGSAFAAAVIRRTRRPWLATGLCEVAIALLTVPILTLPWWSGAIWPALGPERLTDWQGSTVKLVVSMAIITPPAFAMGMVLPLLTTAVLSERRSLSRHGVWLYALNTFGGVIGLALVVGVLIQHLHAFGAMLVAAGFNLVVAAGCFVLHAMQPTLRSAVSPEPSTDALTGDRRALGVAMLVAAGSAAGILATEVLAIQMIMLFAPLSYYAPSVILAAVILLLSLASVIVASRESRTNVQTLTIAATTAGAAIAFAPLLFLLLSQMFEPGPSASLTGYLIKLLTFTLCVLGPAMLAAGMLFPLAVRYLGQHGHQHDSSSFGWLLAASGFGGFAGAEIAHRVLMPQWGIYASLGAIGVAYALGGCLLWLFARQRQVSHLVGQAAVAAALLFICLVWLRHLPHRNPHLEVDVLREVYGREGVISIIEGEPLGRALLMSNQYILGGSGARFDQERQAHLPLMLHPHPRDVAFIGVATGSTPGAALEHAGVEELVAIELSPLVADVAREYFAEVNHGLFTSDRAQVVVEDGRTYMASVRDRFDVVIGDLFLPWGPGEARLYSVEHFRAVKESLRPGGLFCQWLAMYQLTPEQFAQIARTFAEVFPHGQMFRHGFSAQQPALALVGFNDAALDWNVVAARCRQEREAGQLLDPLTRYASGIEMLYLGPMDTFDTGQGVLNTLDNMAVELDAGRQRVTGQPGRKYYHGVRWAEFIDRRAAAVAAQTQIPQAVREQVKLGSRITTWEVLRSRDDPRAAALAAEIRPKLPREILSEARRDWRRWPGDSSLAASALEADLSVRAAAGHD